MREVRGKIILKNIASQIEDFGKEIK